MSSGENEDSRHPQTCEDTTDLFEGSIEHLRQQRGVPYVLGVVLIVILGLGLVLIVFTAIYFSQPPETRKSPIYPIQECTKSEACSITTLTILGILFVIFVITSCCYCFRCGCFKKRRENNDSLEISGRTNYGAIG